MSKALLAGQVAVITGASSGIGALLSKELARLGAVPVLIARSEDKLKKLSEELQVDHDVHVADVGLTSDVAMVFERIKHKRGRVDLLVNNAGYGVFQSLEETSVEVMEDMMNVNYMGTVRCTKAVLPGMREANRGQIVNIASMAGKVGTAKSSGYTATKHAVLGFTNSLRQELSGTGITVSAVNPGPIDTPFFAQADPTGNYVKNIAWLMLQPQQVVDTIMKVIVRKQAEANLPAMAGLGGKLYQLLPRSADGWIHKLLNKK